MIVLVAEGIIPSGIALASVFSASVSGIIMTAAGDGRAGLRRLFNRLGLWRVGIGYRLISFLFIIPIFLLGSLCNPLFGGDPIVYSATEPSLVILPLFIVLFIVVGSGQELGWIGFFMTRLWLNSYPPVY